MSAQLQEAWRLTPMASEQLPQVLAIEQHDLAAGAEARVDSLQLEEALDHQTGADHEDRGWQERT